MWLYLLSGLRLHRWTERNFLGSREPGSGGNGSSRSCMNARLFRISTLTNRAFGKPRGGAEKSRMRRQQRPWKLQPGQPMKGKGFMLSKPQPPLKPKAKAVTPKCHALINSTILDYTVRYYAILYYTRLDYTVLHCTPLYSYSTLLRFTIP